MDGEFDEVVRRLEGDPDLDGYVKDKIRWVVYVGNGKKNVRL